jgi:hypothetical protein
MEKIGALWIKEGKNGKFMSGIIGGKSVLIFKNSRKNNPKHPDYEVFKGQDRDELPPKEDEDSVPF